MHPIDKKINELKLILPKVASPIANYVPYKILKNTLYISGQGPIKDGKLLYEGKVGDNLTIENGIEAAKLCCLNILSIIKHACNDNWDLLDEVVKIGGFVNCTNDFKEQPLVINGASNMLVEILGEKGRHSRFAVGTNSLPLNMAVEIEAIVSLVDYEN